MTEYPENGDYVTVKITGEVSGFANTSMGFYVGGHYVSKMPYRGYTLEWEKTVPPEPDCDYLLLKRRPNVSKAFVDAQANPEGLYLFAKKKSKAFNLFQWWELTSNSWAAWPEIEKNFEVVKKLRAV